MAVISRSLPQVKCCVFGGSLFDLCAKLRGELFQLSRSSRQPVALGDQLFSQCACSRFASLKLLTQQADLISASDAFGEPFLFGCNFGFLHRQVIGQLL